MKVDILIPASPKDQNKLNYVIKGMVSFCPQANDFYVVCPDKTEIELPDEIEGHKINIYNDFEVVPDMVNFMRMIRFRPNWILQQIIKLCQKVTQTKYYSCCDCDLIPCARIDLFKGGFPKLFSAPNSKDEEAFHRFISKATGGDLFKWSRNEYATTNWIADCQMFRKEWVNEMINYYFPSEQDFMCFTALNSFWHGRRDDSIFISEYEMYGQYLFKYHAKDIAVDYVNRRQIDMHQNSQYEQTFIKDFIIDEIDKAVKDSIQFLKLQSNCGACDIRWKTK